MEGPSCKGSSLSTPLILGKFSSSYGTVYTGRCLCAGHVGVSWRGISQRIDKFDKGEVCPSRSCAKECYEDGTGWWKKSHSQAARDGRHLAVGWHGIEGSCFVSTDMDE